MKGLPDGWVRVRMQDLVRINPPRVRPELEDRTPLVFVPMPSVAEDFGGIDVSGRRSFASIKRGYTQFRPGDVLFAKITPCMENGKIAIVPEIRPPLGYGSTEFFVMRPRNAGLRRWIAYCVAQSSFRQLARENMQGAVGQRRVPKVWLEDASVLLAPLPEQHRIVAKIESLFARLDEGVAALKRAEANLERYRASVLKAAVEGRLTEQWRSENPPEETGEELLGRILAERRKRWEAEQVAKFEAKGRKPPRNWKKKYKEPVIPDTSGLPGLPEGWCWVGIEHLTAFIPYALKAGPFGSALKKSFYVESGYKIYGQEQVLRGDPGWGGYYIDEDRFCSLKNCAVQPGDLLISLVGTIGRTLVLPQDIEPGIINPRLIKVSLNREVAVPEFFQAYLRSPRVRQILKRVSHGGTMDVLNMRTLKAVAFPLPPVAEQEFIVQVLSDSSVTLDGMATSFSNSARCAAALRQSILKRAFEGRLVPQDPADEPASILLERIRAEREAERKRRKRRPTRAQRQPASRVS